MLKLIVFVLVATTLYSGYWFVGRSQVQARLTQALVEIDASDVDLTYTTLRTRGYPSRFDTTITDLAFSDPASNMSWVAPMFQLFALSYRPNEVIAVFPNEQVLTLSGEEFTLFTDDMRASGKVHANPSLAFQNATITMDNPRIRTRNGAELAIANVLAAMRLTPETAQTYDAYIEARSIVLPEDVRRLVDPGNLQPPIIQTLKFDSEIGFTMPIKLNSPDSGVPLIETLSITEFALAWGDMSLSAIGDVTHAFNGELTGSITISARNWQQALDLAIAAGVVPQDRRQFFLGVVNSIDETPHIPDTLTATLMIRDGDMMLGPVPLGRAPLLR